MQGLDHPVPCPLYPALGYSHSPNHLGTQFASDTGFGARAWPVVGEDHGLATSIQAEAQRGAQNSAESLQEIGAGTQQLFRGQQNREDQNPSGQKSRNLAGTVQSIPATLLSIAALVTAAVCKVVGAVLLIHRAGGREHTIRDSLRRLNAHIAKSSTAQCLHRGLEWPSICQTFCKCSCWLHNHRFCD